MSIGRLERQGQVEKIILGSIDGIFQYLGSFPSKYRWFRGVKSDIYNLEPSIFRTNENGLRHSKEQEKFLCNRFSDGTGQLIARSSDDELNLLLLMQHYGLPTRLLDWTDSFSVALSFALEEEEGLPTVWSIEPKRFNLQNEFYRRENVPNSQHAAPRKYGKIAFASKIKTAERRTCKQPLAFKPLYPDQRVYIQRGRFTIHGSSETALDLQAENLQEDADPIIRKLILKLARKGRQELLAIKLHNSILYPDREGLTRRLREELSKDPKLMPKLQQPKRMP